MIIRQDVVEDLLSSTIAIRMMLKMLKNVAQARKLMADTYALTTPSQNVRTPQLLESTLASPPHMEDVTVITVEDQLLLTTKEVVEDTIPSLDHAHIHLVATEQHIPRTKALHCTRFNKHRPADDHLSHSDGAAYL